MVFAIETLKAYQNSAIKCWYFTFLQIMDTLNFVHVIHSILTFLQSVSHQVALTVNGLILISGEMWRGWQWWQWLCWPLLFISSSWQLWSQRRMFNTTLFVIILKRHQDRSRAVLVQPKRDLFLTLTKRFLRPNLTNQSSRMHLKHLEVTVFSMFLWRQKKDILATKVGILSRNIVFFITLFVPNSTSTLIVEDHSQLVKSWHFGWSTADVLVW